MEARYKVQERTENGTWITLHTFVELADAKYEARRTVIGHGLRVIDTRFVEWTSEDG